MKTLNKANSDIKEKAVNKGVFLYEIAEKLGMYETTFLRKLRKELSAEEKTKIFSIIDELSAEKA